MIGKIHKLYKSSSKLHYKQKYKAIIEAEIFYTPEGLTEKIPLAMGTLGNINKPSEINSLGQFLALLDVTQKKLLFADWELLIKLK